MKRPWQLWGCAGLVVLDPMVSGVGVEVGLVVRR